jgi:hypothetical protein
MIYSYVALHIMLAQRGVTHVKDTTREEGCEFLTNHDTCSHVWAVKWV